MNTSRDFREVVCRIRVGAKQYERELLLSPRSIKSVDIAEFPAEELVDGEVLTEIIESGRTADLIKAPISLEAPEKASDSDSFVKVDGKYFSLGKRRWYMAGINYWSTNSPAREKSDYWRGQFELSNYNPEIVEGDLAYAEELGLNCLLTRIDFTDLDLAVHGQIGRAHV